MSRTRRKRSDRLLEILDNSTRLAGITHDTPDPDAIAAGWAVYTLVQERLEPPVRLIGGGTVARAENIHMIKLLDPPIELVNEYAPEPDCAAILVDRSAEGANHLLGDGSVRPVAVIDHHLSTRTAVRVPFRDIRPRAAASATIAGGYLGGEHGIEPTKQLATALPYAVRSEVINRRSPFTRTDRGLVGWLSERADHQALAEIEHAPLARTYYEEMMLTLGSTFLYGDTAICFLPQARNAEIVGEFADLLIRCSEIARVLCGAVVNNQLTISVRKSPTGRDAVRILGLTLKGLGHWGGHPNRAGGGVPQLIMVSRWRVGNRHGGEEVGRPRFGGEFDRWPVECPTGAAFRKLQGSRVL